MMGLMVEDVGDRPPQRGLEFLAAAKVNERSGEPLGGELGHPGRERVVGQRSLPAELVEVGEKLLVEGADAGAHEVGRDGDAVEAGEPHAVREQEVVEGADLPAEKWT
jgi:hypothetical protein